MIRLLKRHIDNNPVPNTGIVLGKKPKKEKKEKNSKYDELKRLEVKIREANLLIKDITAILDSSCSRYIDILNDLLREKEKKLKESGGIPYGNQSKGKRKRPKKKTKEMYNKIASECHPDKTEDEDKHEKFMKAKELLDDGDDYGLYNIFQEFSDEDVVMDDFFDIGTEILSKSIELQKIVASNGYKICIIYKAGEQKKAKSLYLEMVMKNIQQLEMDMM